MYSRILVPIDGSENSNRALRHALYLGSNLSSKLIVLYISEIPPMVYVQSQKIIDSINNTLTEEIKKIFEHVDLEAQNYKAVYETVVLKGNPIASVINEYADKNDIDIIVMGSRGRGKVKTAISGSVAHEVFYHTKKPLLIVR